MEKSQKTFEEFAGDVKKELDKSLREGTITPAERDSVLRCLTESDPLHAADDFVADNTRYTKTTQLTFKQAVDSEKGAGQSSVSQ